jgi:long-chain acyl-CoA synthetase
METGRLLASIESAHCHAAFRGESEVTQVSTATPDTATLAAAIESALAQHTLCAAFQVTAAASADRPALRTLGSEREFSWSEYAAGVRTIAGGLYALGVRQGDAVALMLAGCSEFHLIDTAAMHLGAAPFSIYFSNPVEQILPMIRNSEARIVFTQPQYADIIAEVAKEAGTIEHIVVLGDDAGAGTMTLAALEALEVPADFDFEATWRAVTPEDIAGIVYTSGTTGEPKGVEWSHGALIDNMRGLHALAPVSPGGRMVSYLPMAHLAERFMTNYCTLAFGYSITTAPDPKQLGAALAVSHPTRFFGVPRIFEKLGEGAKAIAGTDERLGEALATGIALAIASQSAPLDPEQAVALAEAQAALTPVREKLGMEATEWRGAAAAPTREDTHQLWTALGLPIAEIWGMSETAMTISNPPRRIKMGTVGKPQPGVEAKLADDGELLVRGPIFSRYRKDPEKTREAFAPGGWLKTGDIAAIDEDGYFKIVDRKKEIIINAAGKNIAPAMVENRLKAQSAIIGYAVAIGDRRSYLTALVVLDEEGLTGFAAHEGLTGSFAELSSDATVLAEVARAVEAANATLARVEQIKKYAILEGGWLPGGEEVTQTMKLKRRVINAKYARDIEALYA